MSRYGYMHMALGFLFNDWMIALFMCFFPRQDQNFGLVQRVIKSVVHARIQRLTKVYITLSLDEVARQAGLASTEDVVQELLYMVRFAEMVSIHVPGPSFCYSYFLVLQIETGKVDASINMAEGLVEFKVSNVCLFSLQILNFLSCQLPGGFFLVLCTGYCSEV